MFAKVLLRSKTADMDRAFDYVVPPELLDGLCPGMRVLVPFGRRNTRTEGYVLELSDATALPPERLKPVLSRLEDYPLFSWEALELARWMKEEYDCTLSQCLQAMMPAGIAALATWQVTLTPAGEAALAEAETPGLLAGECEILQWLLAAGGTCAEGELPASRERVRGLADKGLLRLEQMVRAKSQTKMERTARLTGTPEAAQRALGTGRRVENQKRLVELLAGREERPVKELLAMAELSESPLQALVKKGLVEVRQREAKPEALPVRPSERPFTPTPAQRAALASLSAWRKEKNHRPVLLFGVTGSGKTEVYLQLIEEVLAQGKQAIFLVPEIALTPQMVDRVVRRFGNRAAVTHSRLHPRERYEQWKRARTGEAAVMVGPRSAVFAPFPNLGLIVVDEEQERSYHSELTPKYSATEVAAERCRLTGALLLLGSATPALETYDKAERGEYRLLRLPERIGQSRLPRVTVVDMRRELLDGNRTLFSRELAAALRDTLARHKQAMLFLNRRGYSTFVSCRKCGYVATCAHCAVSYTYHAREHKLRCHYCGREAQPPAVCPECGSPYIRYFGAGTQRVEAAVQKILPQARVLRMDADTTRQKGGYEKILGQFAAGEADILIGTQMIARGHDFPGVTLVGVVAADLSLHFGDFRAAETTFQLLTQAAGRAGRREEEGRVFIQTYDPGHYAVQCAARQDYLGFYRAEMALRKQMNYPPFSHLATVLVTGDSDEGCREAARTLAALLEPWEAVEVLGPAPAAVAKVKDRYRWRLLLRAAERDALQTAWRAARERFFQKKHTGILVDFTIDPVIMV